MSSVPESRHELSVFGCPSICLMLYRWTRTLSETIGDDRYKGVRHALISKMAMPEEILVEKDNRTGL